METNEVEQLINVDINKLTNQEILQLFNIWDTNPSHQNNYSINKKKEVLKYTQDNITILKMIEKVASGK